MFKDITFAYPYAFLLLLIVPAIIVWYYLIYKKSRNKVSFSAFRIIKDRKRTIREKLTDLPLYLRLLAFILLVIALARPQSFNTGENVYTEGVDIALVLDISGSMLAEDFKPNRLDAAKKITADFINGRVNDRIGLVIFSRDAFTQCPLTVDYNVLQNLLLEVKSGMIEDGTAIGNAIANGINRLKDSKSKSKVMILLTDGVSNAGEIDPLTGAEIAKHYGIRIYTIGVGTTGQAPYPVQTPFGKQYQMVPVQIDEQVLRTIANETGAKYYRATGNRKLEQIYSEIDRLEKTKIEVTSYRTKKEHFLPWLFAATAVFFLELIMSFGLLRRFP
ncbi:MAG: VWA domain-containing protein [Ignavibacteriaceae bacterium]|nr:VWA domain-containing protein [Ignavibacteriaceae bacterium]